MLQAPGTCDSESMSSFCYSNFSFETPPFTCYTCATGVEQKLWYSAAAALDLPSMALPARVEMIVERSSSSRLLCLADPSTYSGDIDWFAASGCWSVFVAGRYIDHEINIMLYVHFDLIRAGVLQARASYSHSHDAQLY